MQAQVERLSEAYRRAMLASFGGLDKSAVDDSMLDLYLSLKTPDGFRGRFKAACVEAVTAHGNTESRFVITPVDQDANRFFRMVSRSLPDMVSGYGVGVADPKEFQVKK